MSKFYSLRIWPTYDRRLPAPPPVSLQLYHEREKPKADCHLALLRGIVHRDHATAAICEYDESEDKFVPLDFSYEESKFELPVKINLDKPRSVDAEHFKRFENALRINENDSLNVFVFLSQYGEERGGCVNTSQKALDIAVGFIELARRLEERGL